jgi:hypothetical protein
MAYTHSNTTVISDAPVTASFPTSISISEGSFTIASSDAFQGTVAGYIAAGYAGPTNDNRNTREAIQRYSFTSDSNGTTVGNLTFRSRDGGGASSATHGYHLGGFISTPAMGTVSKFAFAGGYQSQVIGQMLGWSHGLDVSSSIPYGFAITYGGQGGTTPITNPGGWHNRAKKVLFATDGDVTLMSSVVPAYQGFGPGISGVTHGYIAGGQTSTPTIISNIYKYPFASDTNVTSVGTLTAVLVHGAGQSSTTHGYHSGGSPTGGAPAAVATIQKWPFATDTNATSIGQLTAGRYSGPPSSSSTVSGYTAGGVLSPAAATDVIDKFPFSSDASATSVGTLAMFTHNNAMQIQD